LRKILYGIGVIIKSGNSARAGCREDSRELERDRCILSAAMVGRLGENSRKHTRPHGSVAAISTKPPTDLCHV